MKRIAPEIVGVFLIAAVISLPFTLYFYNLIP